MDSRKQNLLTFFSVYYIHTLRPSVGRIDGVMMMKVYDTHQIRNVGFYGHQGSGKTTLAEAVVYLGKTSSRLCSVAEGNSNFDFEPEEIKRRSSMSTSVGYAEWGKTLINVIDTPGDSNFVAESVMSVIASDIGVIAIGAVDGIQVGTEKAFKLLQEVEVPRIIFITKMDKERASFDDALNQAREVFGPAVVPLSIPIGSESAFKGVIDLVSQEARLYTDQPTGKRAPIPSELADKANKMRKLLVEKLAEQDDSLIDKYCLEDDLSQEDVKRALGIGMKNGNIVPVFCGNPSSALGVDLLLDIITQYGPTPADRKFRCQKSGEEEIITPTKDGPFIGFVFKSIVDPHFGKISVIRVVSGLLQPDSQFLNVNTMTKERFGQITKVFGKKQETAMQGICGDIIAIPKLKDTKTGHTVVSEGTMCEILIPPLPERVIGYAIKPKSQGDEDKVSASLQKIVEEDPGLEIRRDEEAKDMLLYGLGQVEIDMAVEKLKRKYGVDIETRLPRVPYRETIKGMVKNVEGKHKKQTGGHGQFGVCYIDLEPLGRGEGFVFEDKIFGGAIPKQYIPSVEKGIRDAMAKGVIAGYPVVDIRVRLVDGKYHEVDSDNRSFEIAGSKAFKAAFKQCKPIILEPIMNMTIMIPEEYLGDVMGSINSRRGRVLGMESSGKLQIVKAQVPMSEVLTYASDLRSITSDRGSFTMELSHYEEMPPNLAEKLTQEAKIAEEEE